MLTFNVWPSKIPEFVKWSIKEAISTWVLEISHRSREFSEISRNCISELRSFMDIPDSYKIFYTSSATDAMQLSLLNCCNNNSFHFVNWNFSNLFYKMSSVIWKKADKDEVDLWMRNNYKNTNISKSVDFISITHNETSTWATCTNCDIEYVRKNNKLAALVVDVTSSAWVYKYNIRDADIWLFSVQKCFWLPAWLWIMIVWPKAYNKSLESNIWYFTFERMWKIMDNKFQTMFTPNILNIYLFWKLLKQWNTSWWIQKQLSEAKDKYFLIENFVLKSKVYDFFVKEKKARSLTIICLKASRKEIWNITNICKKNWIILWSWYWVLKGETIRIANFPAISISDIEKLLSCFNIWY